MCVGGVIAKIGRKYSMYVYLYHVAFNYLLCALFGVKFDFPFNGLIELPFDYTLIVNCFTTSLLAAVVPVCLGKIVLYCKVAVLNLHKN